MRTSGQLTHEMAAAARPRIVVTGVGLVTPLGVGSGNVWRRLLASECGVQRVAALAGLPCEVAATVPRGTGPADFDTTRCRLSAKGDESTMAPFVQFALTAASEALDASGWSPQSPDERRRTGVAIGSGIGSLQDIVEASDALRERGHRRISPYFIPRMLVNMAAGHVSIRAGLQGPSAAPATACATGAHALSDARHALASGAADVMLAGGAEACIEPLSIAGFSRMRALSTSFNEAPSSASRPFDARRDGFVMGEGAAVLVLETEEHAARRGANVVAELLGVGLSSDAHHMTSPPDDGDGAYRAMLAAMKDGGMARGASASDGLDYVNAHATSTPAGDSAELRAIARLADGRGVGEPPLAVSSTKGATGHLLGAAGAIEAAFTALAVQHQALPPTINLEEADPAGGAAVEHIGAGHGATSGRPLRAALCNSFGFGGMNASVLFGRYN